MSSESKRRIWVIPLIAIAALTAYAVSTIEIGRDSTRIRRVGSLEDIEALASDEETNLLFIVVDTLRAERMSAYGYSRATTPFIDKLAQSGIRFERHISQSSWTKSSMASLWSGLYPLHIGVTKFNHTMPDQARMPAEILSEAGFKSIGLYRNGWVNGYFGFDQGFEKYYRPPGAAIDPRIQRLRPNAQASGTDENIIADAIEFLRIHGKTSRWFLYLHLMDLHEYTYDDESAIFGNSIADLYDNSLLRTDWVLSTLYDYMARAGLTENTIIVLVSDHGEAFGERGFEGHAREVFPETTETPFIISLPFALPEPVVVTDRTDNIDVWPTLLDLLGLPDQGDVDGRSRRDAILAAAGGEAPAEPEADGEERISLAYLDENWGSPTGSLDPAISIIEGGFRFVSGKNTAGRPFEVLLSAEDGYRTDQKASQPEMAEHLRAEAQRQLTEKPRFEAKIIEIDEMQLDQLRALGYQLP